VRIESPVGKQTETCFNKRGGTHTPLERGLIFENTQTNIFRFTSGQHGEHGAGGDSASESHSD
jgi:hypothetical protein